MPALISPTAIPTLRLLNQRLLHSTFHPTFNQPAEVVAHLGALQGQDYTGAKWSVGLRLPGSTDARIEQAIIDHQIIRTWLFRGTLHLVAAADLHWMTELIARRQIGVNALRYRQLELDEPTLLRATDLLAQALDAGQHLSRPELFAMLEQHGISTAGQRGFYLLQRATLEGWLAQGTAPRNVPTFFRSDTIPPNPAAPTTREAALANLAARYFTSRGPATVADFAYWSGLTMGDARAGLNAVKADLVEVVLDDETYYLPPPPDDLPDMLARLGDPADPVVHLPPGFDELLLGYRDRRAVLEPQYANLVCPGGNGIFKPTIVVNGQMVGTWKRTLKPKAVILTPEPFTTLTDAAYRGFAARAPRFGEFLGLPVVLDPVSAADETTE